MARVFVTKATIDDSKEIWDWRNDAHTRMMSATSDEIPLEAHEKWFDASLSNQRRFLYIGRYNGCKIGMCRFDLDESGDRAEISINLNPAFRGLGLSRPFLIAAIDAFLQGREMTLTAMIKRHNIRSERCFAACGFTLYGSNGDFNFFAR